MTVPKPKRPKREKNEPAFGPQADECRRSPCVNCGYYPSEPHHDPYRKHGGRDGDTVPLCGPRTGVEGCHAMAHRMGREKFWAACRVTLEQAKEKMREQIERRWSGAFLDQWGADA